MSTDTQLTPIAAMRANAVLDAVSAWFGVTLDDLRGRSRRRRMVDARAFAYHIMRDRGMSWPQIALAFGKRHHSTMIGSCQRLRRLIEARELVRRGDGAPFDAGRAVVIVSCLVRDVALRLEAA